MKVTLKLVALGQDLHDPCTVLQVVDNPANLPRVGHHVMIEVTDPGKKSPRCWQVVKKLHHYGPDGETIFALMNPDDSVTRLKID